MAIGRTNAAARGMKSVVGTFTSSKTAAQSTFSVAGLTFAPKIVVVRLLSSSNKATSGQSGFYFGDIDAVQIIDIDANAAVYMYKHTDLETFSSWANMSSPATTFTNGTLTVQSGKAYSTLTDGYWTIGNYEYRIYG